MDKLKVVVTGGAGYIGSHTVLELLENNFEPIIIDNFSNSDKSVVSILEEISGQKIQCFDVDCCDFEATKNVFKSLDGIYGVIHFAAFKYVNESVSNPLKYYSNNINSLINVVKLCNELNIEKLVFSSSCTVYGEPKTLPIKESSPFGEVESPYGYTKQIGENILHNSIKNGATILRYFNPIGVHKSGKLGEGSSLVPENIVPVIVRVALGELDELKVFGNDYNTSDGTCIRDYIHVVDLAKAHIRALQKDEDSSIKIYNIGTGEGCSVLKLIQMFSALNDVEIPYTIVDRRPGDVEKIYADTRKALEQLGWKTELTVEDALKDVWKHISYKKANVGI
ncbi:UDP-glucose 4-epimerase GalE [bacterium]|nr:UDP-glucose 4-epimerase GalE [bacterium]